MRTHGLIWKAAARRGNAAYAGGEPGCNGGCRGVASKENGPAKSEKGERKMKQRSRMIPWQGLSSTLLWGVVEEKKKKGMMWHLAK